MHTRRLIQTLGLGATLTLAGASAFAQTTDGQTTTEPKPSPSQPANRSSTSYDVHGWTNGAYVGGSIGATDWRADCPSGSGCDDNTLGFKLYTGTKFNDYFGAEIGYVNLGRPDTNGGHQTAQGANLSLIAGVPIGDRFGVNAKVGTMYAWTNTTGNVPPHLAGKDRDFGLSYGAGATMALAPQVQLRVDWDRYDLDFKGRDGKVDMLSAGLQYLF
jgi:OOP family OmpA-OmpF porin